MDDNQNDILKNLKSLLIKGFYEDNLYEMASICIDYRQRFQESYLLILYVLENIFYDLYKDLSERPVLKDEVSFYEGKLKDKIDNLLNLLIRKEIDKQILFDLANDLIATFSKERFK